MKSNDNYDREFTEEKDDKWTDCTDLNYSNKRKDSFKVYSNYYLNKILHIFKSQENDGVQMYHVIDEHMSMHRLPQYYFLTIEQIEETFHLSEKLVK